MLRLDEILLDDVNIDQRIIFGHLYRFWGTIIDGAFFSTEYIVKISNRSYRVFFCKSVDSGKLFVVINDIFDNRRRRKIKLTSRKLKFLIKKKNKVIIELVCLKFLSRSIWRWPGEISIDK